MTSQVNAISVLAATRSLPPEWHGDGTVSNRVLDAIYRHFAALAPVITVETGVGRTTLLISHLSGKHLVFTRQDDAVFREGLPQEGTGGSLAAVQGSPLLGDDVEFVIGSTQQTLLHHVFEQPVDAAYLDGPHAYPFPELEYWAIYPHIRAGGLLVIDDIHIPTIANMYDILRVDRMWDLVEVVDETAFLRRTNAATLDPYGEGYWLQGYNEKFTYRHWPAHRRARLAWPALRHLAYLGWGALPAPVKRRVRQAAGR